MRQVDVKKTRFRLLGGGWVVVQNTMGLFSLFIMVITVFGFYTLVYSKYFPNFWVFAGVLVAIWIVLAVFVYKILLPTMIGFSNQQGWEHDNPWRPIVENIQKDLAAVREDIKQLLEEKKE